MKQTYSLQTYFHVFKFEFVSIFHGYQKILLVCDLVCEFSLLSSLCVLLGAPEESFNFLNTEMHKPQMPSGAKSAMHRNEAS